MGAPQDIATTLWEVDQIKKLKGSQMKSKMGMGMETNKKMKRKKMRSKMMNNQLSKSSNRNLKIFFDILKFEILRLRDSVEDFHKF